MQKILISLTVLFLTLSAVFGVLNTNKLRTLREGGSRNDVANAETEQLRLAKEKQLQAREASIAAAGAKYAETEARVAGAEADLIKSHAEKAELQTQLQEKEKQIAELQRQAEESGPKALMPDVLPMPGAGDLQTELEQTRKQLDAAEREKQQLLSAKTRSSAGPTASAPLPSEPPQKRRVAPTNPNLRGTVLAVNQAYNFVVLNLGSRDHVQANAEMLVLRGGTLIGRLRVSSVEPATAIGDIVSSSLARGVEVQPGDIVIYAGTNS
jgi:hypothetical protein